MVFHEIASPGPKHPQLISWPLMAARTIRLKNTSSSAVTIVLVTRSHHPVMSTSPSASSNHGSVRARSSTILVGRIWYESIAIANNCHGSVTLTHAA
jgi:hypothetical protein